MLKICTFVLGVLVILITTGFGGKTAYATAQLSGQDNSAMLFVGFDEAARKINKAAPYMLDEETRVDGATAGPGGLLTYHYTLLRYSSNDLNAELINKYLYPGVKKPLCASSEMKSTLQYGGKFAFSYSGNDGIHIASFSIDRDVCGYSALSP